tara:strand:- start:7583 stop:8620 length:1038 start_codon:yes stop_codon:yes gene_type:complete
VAVNYLHDSWYCAGWSSELGDKPIARTILEKQLVVYREESGDLVALDGRCPHRFAPLAMGSVDGDVLACPYHGLKFDRTGACVLNPHGDGHIPPNARLSSYPVFERNGAIWIWMGDTEKADRSLISGGDWLVSPDYAVATGSLRIEANYQLVVDNLLDLTHAPYLHPTTLGGDPEDTVGNGMDQKFSTDPDDTIHSHYLARDVPQPMPIFAPFWGPRPGDFRAEMRWQPASTLELDTYFSTPGGPKEDGVHIPTLHYLAPESETATRYYFAMGRNAAIDDEDATREMARMARTAFEQEDEPMIKACQDMMNTTDLFSLRPAILKTDIAGVQARRLLAKRIAAQNH